MKTKTLIISALTILSIAGLFAWGNVAKSTSASRGTYGSNTQKSVLVAPSVFHDFGTISMKNGNVTKEFTVTNPTGQAVVLETVLTSCMCTTAFLVQADGSTKGPFSMPGMGYVPPANETIPSGESRIVRVIYDPNAHGPAGVGRIDRFVTLNDASGGTLVYEIKANVTP